MELAIKRVKTHDFENDEEAEAYVDSLLLGKPELPLEIWVKILSSNPALSVQDIQRMCSVNSLFKKLCDTGLIWDEIFKRQFGKEDFWLVKGYTKRSIHPLSRLIIRRIIGNNTVPSPTEHTIYWQFQKTVAFSSTHLQTNRVVTYGIALYWFMGRYVLGLARKDKGAFLYYDKQIDYFETDVNVSDYETILSSRLAGILDKQIGPIRDGQNILVRNKIRKNLFIHEVKILEWLQKSFVRATSDKYDIFIGCSMCNKHAEYACGRCKQQYYCGQGCAQKDWKQKHYNLCNK